jgi:hypothetical protein
VDDPGCRGNEFVVRAIVGEMMRRAGVGAVIGLTIGVGLAGCVLRERTIVYSPINQAPHPFVRRTPADVEVVLGETPLRQHVDVGLFELYQGQLPDREWQSTEQMIRDLRTYAALRGCDAVRVWSVTGPSYQSPRILRAACEMYTDEAAQHASLKPAPPLPGEGERCPRTVGPNGDVIACPGPLVCQADRCVSPYPN